MQCSGPEHTKQSNNISRILDPIDSDWLEKFYRDLFLDGPMIYTLLGSKPMSCHEIIDANEEEWIRAHEMFFDAVPESKKEKIRKEFLEEIQNYTLHEHWIKWKCIRSRFPNQEFLFREILSESPHLYFVCVVNTKLVIKMLLQHYDLFRKELGFDFDPLSAALEFEKEDSIFWKKLFANHFLQGILYGFGLENAYFFSQENQRKGEKSIESVFKRRSLPVNDGIIEIPRFASYQVEEGEDLVIARYQKERTEIQKKIIENNWVELISALLLDKRAS
ncbi:MAG: hypothetical protein WDZ28_04525 [Simkaniaceae bacterium]